MDSTIIRCCFDTLSKGGDKDPEKEMECIGKCSGSVILVVVKIVAAVADVSFR